MVRTLPHSREIVSDLSHCYLPSTVVPLTPLPDSAGELLRVLGFPIPPSQDKSGKRYRKLTTYFYFFGSRDGSLAPDLIEGVNQLEITPLSTKEY